MCRITCAGDTLIVAAVDRLARDTRDLLNILHELRTVGAGFRSLAEPLVDTTSEMAEVIIAVLGIAAKWPCRPEADEVERPFSNGSKCLTWSC
ncbi:recombinase family protein [Ochrobactrum sp. BTU2]|uniref:recombinase family protein n=1 Tax=Ochrobactrum sp. BTU2 TaxID=2856166 RepID=UPI00211A84CE|nr:recombinase family protein [Ochrobactrum sp. BTU2]MCQ9147723.1 recombinase family protein [Ochrobactrum sp. BTU2]